MPFAGTHRLIDFPLSNCHNAGLHDVWVSQQFNPVSLSDHLANGRPWDLDRTDGGLLILHPRQGNDGRGGFPPGTADALWRAAPMIREFAPEALVVVSADAVYALDYGELVEEHVEAGAPVTMVTTEVEPTTRAATASSRSTAGGCATTRTSPTTGRQPDLQRGLRVRPRRGLDGLDERGEDNEEGAEDLGDTLLPQLVDAGDVREHRFDGFWRDVGTIDAYWSAHMELLAEAPPIDLDDPGWPILTRAIGHRASARVLPGAELDGALLAPGATRRRPRRALGDRPRRAGGGGRGRPTRSPARRRGASGAGRARDPRRPRRGRGGRAGRRAPTATSR